MARQYTFDDSGWSEVMFINGYAVFMGYLMLGVRGLGLLVVTWTTVVLLGGFVSDLQKKDFWCVTGITFFQTAGVFNFLLREKINDMVQSFAGLLGTTVYAAVKKERKNERTSKLVRIISLLIQGLVLGIVVCPLGVLYILGLYISAGISLWRLIEHDFGNAGGANQKPSLIQVLYSLAVAQGVLFGYKTIHALQERSRIAKFVANDCAMEDDEVVAEYLEETIAGCKKDPSFATGRNFVTYGVDLMIEAKTHEGFIAGIKVLGGSINNDYVQGTEGRKVLAKHLLTRSYSWSHMIQRLIEIVGSRSPYSREVREHAARIVSLVAPSMRLEQFPRVIQCISSVLDEESNQQENEQSDQICRRRYHSTRVELLKECHQSKDYERVELLERYELEYQLFDRWSTCLPDFSMSCLIRWLVQQCLPCKTKTMERERNERQKVHGFDGLLVDCVNIIHRLAVDEDNLRSITGNTVLQNRITMAPLKLHRDNHDACSLRKESELQMLEKCWVLTEWLVGAAVKETSQGQIKDAEGGGGEIQAEVEEGEDQERLLQSSSGCTVENNAIINSIKSTIKNIFDCLDCEATQKKEGVQILLHLSLDLSFIMDSESGTRRLTWILLLISISHVDDTGDWMVSGFTDRNKNMCDFDDIKRLAGKKLWEVFRVKHELPSEESARKLQLIILALGDLTGAFSDDAEDVPTRTHATLIITDYAWLAYNPQSDSEKKVKEILIDVFPNVVKEVLIRCASTREDRQSQATDVRVENGGVTEDDDLENRMSQDGYTANERL